MVSKVIVYNAGVGLVPQQLQPPSVPYCFLLLRGVNYPSPSQQQCYVLLFRLSPEPEDRFGRRAPRPPQYS